MQSSLYAIALTLCVFSTGILNGRSRGKSRRQTYLIAYLAAEALGFALELLVSHPHSPLKALWLSLLMSSSLLPAPLLFLAVRESSRQSLPSLKSLGLIPWICFGSAVVLLLPLTLTAHLGSGWPSTQNARDTWHFNYIHEGMIAVVAIFSIQVPYYLLKARRLIWEQSDSAAKDSFGKRTWLHLPLIIVGTTWALGMLRVWQCASGAPAELITVFAAVDVLVTTLALYLILYREFNLSPPAPVTERATPVAASSGPDCASKYAKSHLDTATCIRINQKIENALGRDAIHTDPLLSLRSLSSHLGEKSHYVSQVINQERGKSFYELVNEQRVKHAQKLLKARPQATVLEIAIEVGFNSKSTFNTAFRRHTELTPSQFRKISSP